MTTKFYATIISLTLAATATGCGSIGLTQGGEKDSKDAKAKPASGSQTSGGKGVRFALGLPKSFEDEGKNQKEDVAVEESGMAAEFEESFESERIIVTCDGEPMKDYDKVKGKKMRGIFELTLIGTMKGHGPKDYPVAPGGDEEDFETKKGLTKDKENKAPNAINPDELKKEKEEQEGKDELEAPKPEPAPEAPWEAPWDAPSAMIVEHLAIPYVCEGNASVEIVELTTGYDYHISANLYSASGALRYSGGTPDFTAGETKAVDLVMSPVQSSNVSINVIFADGESKKPAKK